MMYRAPVLVAIALVEHGVDAISAVTLIRSKRWGLSEST
jgi:transcription-repair coupling factor (superfamily II helicase)